MQNAVYECKQNSEDFFSSLTVTCFCFGNRPANGLVTEQPQYSVVVCIFHILQNTEIQLISNDLRLIFTCSLLLASPCIFHLARHTFAVHSLAKMAEEGMDLYCSLPILSTYLGHQSLRATNNYVRLTSEMYPELIRKIDIIGFDIFPKM